MGCAWRQVTKRCHQILFVVFQLFISYGNFCKMDSFFHGLYLPRMYVFLSIWIYFWLLYVYIYLLLTNVCMSVCLYVSTFDCCMSKCIYFWLLYVYMYLFAHGFYLQSIKLKCNTIVLSKNLVFIRKESKNAIVYRTVRSIIILFSILLSIWAWLWNYNCFPSL